MKKDSQPSSSTNCIFHVQDDIKTLLDHKRTNEHQFEQVGQFWMGADYIKEEEKWTWTHHYQDFNNWTNWQSKVPNIGCLGAGCTEVDGLILRADSKFVWNAFVDKSTALPYVCLSKCKKGYQWFPSKYLKAGFGMAHF